MAVIIEDRVISGGFAFSAKSDDITFSKAIEEVTDATKDIVTKYATTSRDIYCQKIAEQRAAGTKLAPLNAKREALSEAKAKLVAEVTEEKFNEAIAEFNTENSRYSHAKRESAKMIARELKKLDKKADKGAKEAAPAEEASEAAPAETKPAENKVADAFNL